MYIGSALKSKAAEPMRRFPAASTNPLRTSSVFVFARDSTTRAANSLAGISSEKYSTGTLRCVRLSATFIIQALLPMAGRPAMTASVPPRRPPVTWSKSAKPVLRPSVCLLSMSASSSSSRDGTISAALRIESVGAPRLRDKTLSPADCSTSSAFAAMSCAALCMATAAEMIARRP